MKRFFYLLPALLVLAAPCVNAQMSVGNYRIPYLSGVGVTALLDHVSHPLTNRVDLQSTGTNTPYFIIAAADGVVRAVRDSGTVGCGTCTNYVWIEHANGEWTGYFYLQGNSVPVNVGDPVTAGQSIGIEGRVGSPGGNRLRFEVGVPANPNDPIVVSTGMIKGSSRVPVICNVPDNVLRQGNQYTAAPCAAYGFSYGTYRIPYSNSVVLKVSNDHLTHSPTKTRYDLVGIANGTGSTYPIVAAAAGTVMWIVDFNTKSCTTNNCDDFNNYVWIRHSNGEWTKYTHFMTGTVTGKAGLTKGANVVAGQYLGDEGRVGAASGDHLHFEVAVPDNGHLYTNAFQPNITDAFDVLGGFIHGINRIPLFCGIPGHILFESNIVVAANCLGGGCTNSIVLPAKIIRGTEAHVASSTLDTANNNVSLDTYASLALLAGNKVTLRPGFKALTGSYLRAAIRPCFNAP